MTELKMYQKVARLLERDGPKTEQELIGHFFDDEAQTVTDAIKVLEDNGAVSVDDSYRYHFIGW